MHDPITWYGRNYTGMPITQWDFQSKEKLGWLYECFMLEGQTSRYTVIMYTVEMHASLEISLPVQVRLVQSESYM